MVNYVERSGIANPVVNHSGGENSEISNSGFFALYDWFASQIISDFARTIMRIVHFN